MVSILEALNHFEESFKLLTKVFLPSITPISQV